MSMYSICTARLATATGDSTSTTSEQKQQLSRDSVKSFVSRRSLNWTDELSLDNNFTEILDTEHINSLLTVTENNEIYIDDDTTEMVNASFMGDLYEQEESGSGLLTTDTPMINNWTSVVIDAIQEFSNNITNVMTGQLSTAPMFSDSGKWYHYVSGTIMILVTYAAGTTT